MRGDYRDSITSEPVAGFNTGVGSCGSGGVGVGVDRGPLLDAAQQMLGLPSLRCRLPVVRRSWLL